MTSIAALSLTWSAAQAPPAQAVVHNYGIVGGELIFDSTAFGPRVQFRLDTSTCLWIASGSQIIIDDVGDGFPVLLGFALGIQCTFSIDSSDSTSQPGSTVKIELDLVILATGLPLAGAGSTMGSIDWGSLTFQKSGNGVRCTETVTGGCAAAGLTVGVWEPGPALVSPANLDPFTFSVNGQILNVDICPFGDFPIADSCIKLTATR